ncbi:alpha/beta hydrolase [Amycolatopsis carbonis]|uniref:Alpha/beta hydrolase n=1 Tax=Amycolatopsis carbonis TaxID=715471 RepID=A0A9Y2IID5_9PSEU|nr:alpha/beta hydrolase [Amycolatopsis sp. 2-15]WIX80900.1 alpha/beta hydrolase [Amycolatopsis sp. 2-15]
MRLVAAAALLFLPLLAVPASASTTWTPCPTSQEPTAECGFVDVPIDRADPGSGTTRLALVRLPATHPAQRIGSLLINPGGPGGSGVGYTQFGAITDPVLRQRFDIVGFDPRGVWFSKPAITCDPAQLADPSVSRFPSTATKFAALVEHNRAVGETCLAKTGPLLGHVDTRSAAEDVDAIRVALGEQRISWLGVSYGTELGAAYAEAHPDRVRAMVLDGAIDHGRPPRQSIVEEAAATEDSLVRFASWCSADDGCALHGQDVLADYDNLVAHGAWSSGLGRVATGEELASGVYGYLYIRDQWPDLGRALAAASTDAAQLTSAAQFFSPSYGMYRAIGCQDFPSPFTGVADLRATAAVVKTVAPHSWRYSEWWDFASGCAGWPLPARNPPHPDRVHGVPPILVVGGAHDPATPLAWARGLAADLEGAVLLTRLDDGHTGLLNSACARAAETKYLVSGLTPPRGTICR